jgi:dTDP-4-dehydrorhamnose reductase
MKIIITGSNGYLGQHLTDFLSKRNFDVIALSRGENKNTITPNLIYFPIDLTNRESVTKIVTQIQPDIIIHNAAMSKPDVCDNNKEECLLQNVTSTEYLLNAASTIGCYFIYVSTDFIFGENGPHSEDEKPNPLNFYGQSKFIAEELVKKSGLSYNIMRPVFIYGPASNNMKPTFLHWVKNNLEQGKRIKVVNDQRRTPTYVYDICKGLLAMIEKRINGDFHLAGKDILSPYKMAITVANILHLDADLIEPVTSETFPEPVVRAKHSGLKIEKASNVLGYEPISFEEGVSATFTI